MNISPPLDVPSMDLSQPIDISGAVVTEQNPARQEGTLDYVRCATLHNYLVQLQWIAHGGSLEDLQSQSFTFFTEPYSHDNPQVEEARDSLVPSVVAFLELARIPNGDSAGSQFFAWASGVASASVMFYLEDLHDDDEGEEHRFFTLYAVDSSLAGKPAGLIYDQERHRATFAVEMEDLNIIHPVEEREALWFPLETILSNWIQLVTINKVVAMPEPGPAPSSRLGAWTWNSYSEEQVTGAVAAFRRLTLAIEERRQDRQKGKQMLPTCPGTGSASCATQAVWSAFGATASGPARYFGLSEDVKVPGGATSAPTPPCRSARRPKSVDGIIPGTPMRALVPDG